MTLDQLLAEVFDRGLRDGLESLNPTERELFLIQDFIIEYEMNGLSGYFYNRLPNLNAIAETVASMQKHGFVQLGNILSEATKLFDGYSKPVTTSTWRETLKEYDPMNRLRDLSDRMEALKGYGLREADRG